MISARILVVLAFVPLLSLTARADKIHFLSKTDNSKVTGNAPNYIEGIVVSESEDKIEVRVQGGTMILDRKRVAYIEKDGLKIADIEGRERASAARLQDADSERLQTQGQWADAVARKREVLQKEEPKRELRIVVDFKGILPDQVLRFYNPVLHRIDMRGIADAIEKYLLQEIRRLELDRR